jgi:hypothetical protein
VDAAASGSEPLSTAWESDETLEVTATDTGVWNAVVMWFEVCPMPKYRDIVAKHSHWWILNVCSAPGR